MKSRLLLLLILVLFNFLTASGQAWLWGVQGDGGLKTDIYSSAVATNKFGNVYQTGTFYWWVTFGTDTLTDPTGNGDGFLVKYDKNGNLLWTSQSRTGWFGDVYSNSVATDDSGNSYVTGLSGEDVTFNGDTLKTNGGLFFVKYDSNGNVLWQKQPLNNSSSVGYSVALDKFGHEYITGVYTLLSKYDRNGNLIWNIPLSGQLLNSGYANTYYNYSGYSVATDSSDNIYVTGIFGDTLKVGGYEIYSKNIGIFIVKCDSNGNVLWLQGSTNTPIQYTPFRPTGCYSVATDLSGDAYLTATFNDTLKIGNYTFTTPSDTTYTFFVMKFNPDGTIAWGKQAVSSLGTLGRGRGSYSISNDDSNHLYISGAQSNEGNSSPFIFAGQTIKMPSQGYNQYDASSFLLKLDTSGNIICVSTLEGGGSEASSIASDETGQYVYLGGAFESSLNLGVDTLSVKTGGFYPFDGRWQTCCNLSITSDIPSLTICSGQGVNLVANGGSNYIWSPSIGLNDTSGSNIIATPLVTTTYNVTAWGGCSSTDDVVIIVDTLPSLGEDTVLPICLGDSTTLKVSGAEQYLWFPSDGLNATSGSKVIANPTINTTYTIVGTNLNGCSDSEKIVVTINQLPVIGITPSQSICDGDSLLLTASGGESYSWSPVSGLRMTTGDNVMDIPTNNVTYTVMGTDSAGCSAQASDTITLKYGVNTPIITDTDNVLTSSATEGNQWYLNGFAINGATNETYKADSDGCYSVIATNIANGCSTTSDTFCIRTLSGIKQLTVESGQLTVYPNPTTGQFTIKLSGNQNGYTAEIYNVVGERVYESVLSGLENTIDLSSQSDGMYFVYLKWDEGVEVGKVMVER